MAMIKDFESWKMFEKGDPIENKLFVEQVTAEADSRELGFINKSSSIQTNNGTVVLGIDGKDPNFKKMLDEVIREYNLSDKFKEGAKKPQNHDNLFDFFKQSSFTYIVYKRGSVRPEGGSKDYLQFTPDPEGIQKLFDWIVKDMKKNMVEAISLVLDQKKIISLPKGKHNIDPKFFEEQYEKVAMEQINNIRTKNPDLYRAICPDLLFFAFLTKYRGMDKIKGETRYGYLAVLRSNTRTRDNWTNIDYHVRVKTVINQTQKKVEARYIYEFQPPISGNYSMELDETEKKVRKEILKSPKPLSELTHQFRGRILSKNLGI